MTAILPGLSERLKLLRKQKGVTQVEMSKLLNCTDRHYQKVEYGQINISATMLMDLADYFNVTTDYLLGRDQ